MRKIYTTLAFCLLAACSTTGTRLSQNPPSGWRVNCEPFVRVTQNPDGTITTRVSPPAPDCARVASK